MNVHGILLLDKPLGLSSNQALGRARRLLGAAKAGHTGALDPMATGMLPCCFGEATKIAGFLLGSHKAYTASVALGAATETGDREGRIVQLAAVPPIDAGTLHEVLARFTGRIRQRPPAYSALKRNGVPLYRLARQGIVVDVPEREVDVHRLTARPDVPGILDRGWRPTVPAEFVLGRPPDECGQAWPTLSLEVVCGSGTYIRSLAADIGLALGTVAHLAALRRPWVSPFEQSALVSLPTLEAAVADGRAADLLLPVAAGLAGWRRIDVDAAVEQRLRQGQLARLGTEVEAGPCRVHGPNGGLLALADVVAGGDLVVRRVFAPGI